MAKIEMTSDAVWDSAVDFPMPTDEFLELQKKVNFLLDNTFSVYAGKRVTMREFMELRSL